MGEYGVLMDGVQALFMLILYKQGLVLHQQVFLYSPDRSGVQSSCNTGQHDAWNILLEGADTRLTADICLKYLG